MPTPNFDEILAQARQYQSSAGEQQASERTSGLMAKGFSGLVENILKAQTTPKETYTSYIDPTTGMQSSIPRTETGGTILDILTRKISGTESQGIPKDMIGLSPEQTSAFASSKALLGVKRQTALDLVKQKALAEETKGTKEFNTPMGRWLSNYAYMRLDPTMTLEEVGTKPLLTYGDARFIKGLDDELKMLGLIIKSSETPLGTTAPIAQQAVEKVSEERKSIIERMRGGKPKTPQKTVFNTIEEADAAKLPSGTIVTIGGRRARIK